MPDIMVPAVGVRFECQYIWVDNESPDHVFGGSLGNTQFHSPAAAAAWGTFYEEGRAGRAHAFRGT